MTAENQSAMDQEVNGCAAETIQYQMIDKNGDCFDIDPIIAEIIHEGFKRIPNPENISDFIRAANREIVKNCGTNIDITGNLGDISIEKMQGAYINNVERLKVVLGKNFSTLVRDEEIATQDLIDIACDADDPRAPEVRGCITIIGIVSVNWHPNGRGK